MSAAEKTTDHDTIRDWVEQRGGHPARVAGTGKASDASDGVLRIDFAEPDDSLERILVGRFLPGVRREQAGLPLPG